MLGVTGCGIDTFPGYITKVGTKAFDDVGNRFADVTDAANIAAYLDPRTKTLTWASKFERD